MQVKSAKKIIAFNYDFTRDGGAVGTIDMGVYLPNPCIITQAWVQTQTSITSGGSATIEVAVIGAGGGTIIPAAAIASYPTAGNAATVLDVIGIESGGNVAASIIGGVNSEAGQVGIIIGTAALTAGKFNCYIEYIEVYDTAAV